MKFWTYDTLGAVTFNFNSLSSDDRNSFLSFMNTHFPPDIYTRQITSRRLALENMAKSKDALKGVVQKYPSIVDIEKTTGSPDSLNNHAIVLTAGGEGERLRLSLIEQGVDPELLKDFTKATYPLPDFYGTFGTLQTNLAVISSFCDRFNIEIPVIVTTGPQGSITSRVIPEILKKNSNFGLKSIRVVEQDERLHFSNDEKIVVSTIDGQPRPVTQPDETGGPLMKLKQKLDNDESILDWLEKRNCRKLIIVQATALYHQKLLPSMAKALESHDCIAVGVNRTSFPEKDPFGTFVSLCKENKCLTMIMEQEIRNDITRTIKNESGTLYLPYNTGFYGFDLQLLRDNDLPDYATPPKELIPGLPRSPKIGYAATDILPPAKNPAILTADTSMFKVLKTTADLRPLSEMGKQLGLVEICKERAARRN